MNENELFVNSLFPTCFCSINKPEFLNSARIIFDEYVSESESNNNINPLYPVVMTQNMANDERIKDLSSYILNTSWNILDYQGYDMQYFYTYFMELWGQEHRRGSGMDYHVHGFSSQISGFYFIDVPEESGVVIFHDPRHTKTYADLPQKNMNEITFASSMVNYKPKAGDIYFHNSWMPHSFTKNGDEKPFKFIHFNIMAVPKHLLDSQQTSEVKQPIVV